MWRVIWWTAIIQLFVLHIVSQSVYLSEVGSDVRTEALTTYNCGVLSASGTNNATSKLCICRFNACFGDSVSINGCDCSGSVMFDVSDTAGTSYRSNLTVDYGGCNSSCPLGSFSPPLSTCRTYSLRMGCKDGGSCISFVEIQQFSRRRLMSSDAAIGTPNNFPNTIDLPHSDSFLVSLRGTGDGDGDSQGRYLMGDESLYASCPTETTSVLVAAIITAVLLTLCFLICIACCTMLCMCPSVLSTFFLRRSHAAVAVAPAEAVISSPPAVSVAVVHLAPQQQFGGAPQQYGGMPQQFGGAPQQFGAPNPTYQFSGPGAAYQSIDSDIPLVQAVAVGGYAPKP